MNISFIVPTVGRASLADTVASIELESGDELLVIRHNPPSGDWGSSERNEGMARARCPYLAFIDDDDVYVSGHRRMMAAAIAANPTSPNIFRVQFPSGRLVWQRVQKMHRNGNIDTSGILVPNDKNKLYRWNGTTFAEYWFFNNSRWSYKQYIWRSEVIAIKGHDDIKAEQALSFKQLAASGRKGCALPHISILVKK